MKHISYYLTVIKIYIQAHYLSYRYHQALDDICKAYKTFYADYDIVQPLCKRCWTDNIEFEDAYNDLYYAKIMVEEAAHKENENTTTPTEIHKLSWWDIILNRCPPKYKTK